MSPSKNRKTIRIPRSAKFVNYLESRLYNSHILENLVFPEGRDKSVYEITKHMVEAFEQSGIEKEKIFAFIKTGRLLSIENLKDTTSEERREWIDAIKQYKSLIKAGALQPSDSLVPFIQESKEIPNPRKSKSELEHIFDSRDFHNEVIRASRNQFINYDFPNSVLNAYRNLLVRIQAESRLFDLDGTRLMTSAFNPKKPVLQCSLARLTKDASIQEGIMHLYLGAVLCIRNVFAHKNIYMTNVNQTLDYLSFSSFLFKILDVMEKPKPKNNEQKP